MAKHTPGPWHVRLNLGPNVVSEHGDDPATISDDSGRFIAAVKAQGPATDANARLIAAAPELLEALCECAEQLETLRGDCEAVEIARAAVLKAIGEE